MELEVVVEVEGKNDVNDNTLRDGTISAVLKHWFHLAWYNGTKVGIVSNFFCKMQKHSGDVSKETCHKPPRFCP